MKRFVGLQVHPKTRELLNEVSEIRKAKMHKNRKLVDIVHEMAESLHKKECK